MLSLPAIAILDDVLIHMEAHQVKKKRHSYGRSIHGSSFNPFPHFSLRTTSLIKHSMLS